MYSMLVVDRDQRDKNMTLQAVNENSSIEIWKSVRYS